MHAGVNGPGGAYLSALQRLQWTSTTPFAILDHQGHAYDLRVTDPRTIKELAKDAWYDRMAVESEVHADIFGRGGVRGYGRGKTMVDGCGLTLEQSDGEGLLEWAKENCHTLEDEYTPWLKPLQGMVRTALRKKKK